MAVVDDDESVCRSFSRLLRISGFQPVSYASAEAFLEDSKHPQFDCLVLDIQLAGMSGLELKDALSEHNDETSIIIITAYDDPEVRSEAENLGCAGFFLKTDSGKMIIAAIEKAAGHQYN